MRCRAALWPLVCFVHLTFQVYAEQQTIPHPRCPTSAHPVGAKVRCGKGVIAWRTMVRALRGLTFVACAAALAACPVPTDVGHSCDLVKPAADGGFIPILEGDLAALQNKDILSFGKADCEDLVCIRDSTTKVTGVSPDTPARGYCSKTCTMGNTSDCQPENGAEQDNPATRYSCRALLLDEQALGNICTQKPDLCRELNGVKSPLFCARGGSPDAGR